MNIAIIGAGLVGRLLAWRLHMHYSQTDKLISITLVDEKKRNHFGTGLVAAAMVAPYTEAVSTEAITQVIGERSFKLWPHWLSELEAATAKSVEFNKRGTLVVSHAQDDASWQRFRLKAKAVVDDSQMRILDKPALETLEPELANNFAKALFFADEGVINNPDLYPALEQYLMQADNIAWFESARCEVISANGAVKVAGESSELFDHIFDCRGNGAKADLKQLRSVRGEVICVKVPEVNITRAVRLMHPRFPLYIAPRDNHEYVIGATQIESDADTPVTVRSGLELLSALYSLHQGFGEAQILGLHTGLRPTFINNLPCIEFDNKIIRINGLYRHGYLFAPALISDVIAHLDDKSDDIYFPQIMVTSD